MKLNPNELDSIEFIMNELKKFNKFLYIYEYNFVSSEKKSLNL
jgi:hypothetical protein